RVNVQAAPFHRLLRGMLEQSAGAVAEVLRDVNLLGRAARGRRGRATGSAPRAAAKAGVAEEVGEELVEETPATERRPPCPAALTLKLPQVLFADGDRPLLAVLPDPNRRHGGPTPVDLAHRGGHEKPPRSGRFGGGGVGARGRPPSGKVASPEVCSAF